MDMSENSRLRDSATSADPFTLRRTFLGVLAGGGLLAAIMLMVAGIAILAGKIGRDESGRLCLAPWLVLEIVAGGFASLLAGATSRRVAQSYRGPMALAICAFTIGLLEATEILRHAAVGGAEAPAWLVLLAPLVTATGVLLGGWQVGTSFDCLRTCGMKSALTQALWCSSPAIVLAAAAGLSLFVLPRLADASETSLVASALTLDFTVVVPGLAIASLVRAQRAPWLIIIPTFVAGYAAAAATIPAQHNALLEVIRLLIVPVELCVVIYLLVVARRTISSAAGGDGDFATRFRIAARKVLASRIPADILTTEISIIYYAFGWRRPLPVNTGAYSMHRRVGYLVMMFGMIMVLFVETVPMHLLVSLWSGLAAWILTGLSVYACVWLVGDYRAIVARPLRVTPTHIALRVGVRWEADIPLECIERADLLSRIRSAPQGRRLVAGLLGQANVSLKLKRPIEVIGMYGMRKTVDEIWLTVDEAELLCKELRSLVDL